MVTDLVPGANAALPGDSVSVLLDGPFDLSALVLGAGGTVAGDADFVFYNAPRAPGVQLTPGRVTVTPTRLRVGATRVVVVASPERAGVAFGSLPAPATTLTDGGHAFARLVPPALRTETAVLLAELYRRDGRWRVRAIGQGYADGLAGLARDFGVDVTEDGGAGRGPHREGGGAQVRDAGRELHGEVVVLTNAERARHGLPALNIDARLTRAAQTHTEDMVRRAFFDHCNPDGEQVWDRARAAGYAYRKVAENIAAGQRGAAEVVRGWMDSPGHRANILDGEVSQIGVGYAEGGGYGTCWTQVFGTPR